MNWKLIEAAQWKLRQHPLTSRQSLNSIKDLQIFMVNHVFAVWDFMCLVKSLQQVLAPSGSPWSPEYSGSARRWVNEIILGEESDITIDGGHASHFESYIAAMQEIGLETTWITDWPAYVKQQGFTTAVTHPNVPEPAKHFMMTTFEFIDSNKPWVICAALAFGRENLLPEQFQSVLTQLQAANVPCDKFKWYLARHVDIDGNEHGPAATRLLEELCDNDPIRQQEATQAAIKAIQAREKYWDLIIQNYSI